MMSKALQKPFNHALAYYFVIGLFGILNSEYVVHGPHFRACIVISIFLFSAYLCWLIRISTSHQRRMFLVGMVVCAFGENLATQVLNLYHFAGGETAPYSIPPYVILGHGYTIWTALVLSEPLAERANAGQVLIWLFGACVALCAALVVVNRDLIGASWAFLFLLPLALLKRREHRLLLCTTFLLCTGLELLGVHIKAWTWHASTYYYASSEHPFHSPPAGVGGFYAMADFFTLLFVLGPSVIYRASELRTASLATAPDLLGDRG